jgi:hypothetical protein
MKRAKKCNIVINAMFMRHAIFLHIGQRTQGVTNRCRLVWLTYSALVYDPKCEGNVGGGGLQGSQPMSTAFGA